IPPMTSIEKSVAEVSTTRKSHARASSNPPPTAMPCTAAIVGIRRDSRRRNDECTSLTKVRNIFGSNFANSSTSAPLQKFSPSDRITERSDIAYCHFVKGFTEFLIKSTAYLVVWRICQCHESSVATFFKA